MNTIRGWFLKSAILLSVASAFLLVLHTAIAATLYIDPAQSELQRGDTVAYAVRLDVAEDECVNTVDATISYGDILNAVDVSRGDSILSLWLEDPTIDETNRTITFAGGIPNGYCGRIQGDPRLTNIIAEIIFRAPSFSVGRSDVNEARVVFEEGTRVFLNDGAGTEATLTTHGAQISLTSNPTSAVDDNWTAEVNADTRPPEAFSIELVQQNDVFDGKYFIVFNTTDKQSGIDHYEVMEEPLEESGLFKWGAADAPWVETRSPYVLQDQNLRSTIRVRAIDKAGNERIATLVADESLQRNFMILDIVIAVVVLVLVLVIGFVVWRTLRRRRPAMADEPVQSQNNTSRASKTLEIPQQGNTVDASSKSTTKRTPKKSTKDTK